MEGTRRTPRHGRNRRPGPPWQRDDPLRTFATVCARAAHDLRNALSSLTLRLEVLREEVEGADIPQSAGWQESLGRMEATTGRMRQRVDELVALARVTLGQPQPLHRELVDLATLVQRLAREYEGLSPRHKLRVEAESCPSECDPHLVEQVLLDLVGNAFKYSPAGGEVAVEVRRENPQWVMVRVTDQGIGIPEADRERIFEPFQRAENVGAIEGTGVGLAAARQIVQQHGGRITVTSEEGRGTAFCVYLPGA